jgi:hypothetical protein
MAYRFRSELWEWPGKAAWHFVTLPEDVTDDIDERMAGDKRGFGSVRVEVTIGTSTWRTSVFPDTKVGSFILPVKKQVRAAEGLEDGAPVDVELEVIDA